MVSIEFHPENGRNPHVVVWKTGGHVFWFARRTREEAKSKAREIKEILRLRDDIRHLKAELDGALEHVGDERSTRF